MRSVPGSFDLSFLVPRAVLLGIAQAEITATRGCTIELEFPLVRIRGDSRVAVFDAASDLVRHIPRRDTPISISAILHTPERPSGFDRWSIIVGADVAFSPTSLDPHFPRAPTA
ncbi:hypothetical protein [Bradyrhizobium roseum]|uniref:hypothetical protein n=1 Tax=Bradyrhizobium roseum TaxID=3056648 RepID=UPI002618F4F5|nr:hypothetical protein [Bradyrhizobium roseus]WKA31586.1 hypothetical protein QUH67_16125 [Bradyrhizobium roseus]